MSNSTSLATAEDRTTLLEALHRVLRLSAPLAPERLEEHLGRLSVQAFVDDPLFVSTAVLGRTPRRTRVAVGHLGALAAQPELLGRDQAGIGFSRSRRAKLVS
jgi:hypothetical protein